MEALAGRVEMSAGAAVRTLPVQVLLRMIVELKGVLGGLRAHLGRARQNPAWDFHKKQAQRSKMESRKRKSLERDLERVRMDLEMVRRTLEAIETRANRPARKRPAKKKKKSRVVFSDFPAAANTQAEFGF